MSLRQQRKQKRVQSGGSSLSRPQRRAAERLSIANKQYEIMLRIPGVKPNAFTQPGAMKCW